MDLIMTKDFQKFNIVQLYFATIPSNTTNIAPSQFYLALFMALNNSTIPLSHKNYIAEKLNLKSFNDKQHLIDMLINDLEKFTAVSYATTPTYVIDGGMRVISVLINYSDLDNIDVIKNINRLLLPCFKQHESSQN